MWEGMVWSPERRDLALGRRGLVPKGAWSRPKPTRVKGVATQKLRRRGRASSLVLYLRVQALELPLLL